MKFVVAIVIILFGCISADSNQQHVASSPKESIAALKYHLTYTKDLEDTVRTIDLSYVAWFCQCANWVEASKHEKYQKNGELSNHTMFIEPADSSLELADTIGYTGDVIRFTGKFYKEKGYPKKYSITEMNPEKAKVFRFTAYKILSSGYTNFR